MDNQQCMPESTCLGQLVGAGSAKALTTRNGCTCLWHREEAPTSASEDRTRMHPSGYTLARRGRLGDQREMPLSPTSSGAVACVTLDLACRGVHKGHNGHYVARSLEASALVGTSRNGVRCREEGKVTPLGER